MQTEPTIKFSEDGPEVGIDTARLILRLAIEREEEMKGDEPHDLAQKNALN